jgi:hypothetical protein
MTSPAYLRPIRRYQEVQALAEPRHTLTAAANEPEAFEPQTISDRTFTVGLALFALGAVIVWGPILMRGM